MQQFVNEFRSTKLWQWKALCEQSNKLVDLLCDTKCDKTAYDCIEKLKAINKCMCGEYFAEYNEGLHEVYVDNR